MLRFRSEGHESKIIVHLWSDEHRKDDLSMDNSCPHVNIVNNLCTSCGCFIGKWGEEKSILNFYKHSLLFVYRQNIDVHILSRYIIPPELKVSDFSILGDVPNRYRQIVFFTHSGLVMNSFLTKPNYNKYRWFHGRPVDLMSKELIDSSTVFLNPSKNDLGFNIRYFYVNERLQYDKWYSIIKQ